MGCTYLLTIHSIAAVISDMLLIMDVNMFLSPLFSQLNSLINLFLYRILSIDPLLTRCLLKNLCSVTCRGERNICTWLAVWYTIQDRAYFTLLANLYSKQPYDAKRRTSVSIKEAKPL